MDGLSLEYLVGIRREVADALQGIFGPTYPDAEFRNNVHVTGEFPQEAIHYPAIYVTYSEGPLNNMGLGHYEVDDTDGSVYFHWMFKGNLNFNVLAEDPLSRDKLAAGLMNILAFGKKHPLFSNFYADLVDNDWVPMDVNTEVIQPRGISNTPAPWNPSGDVQIFGRSYSVDVMGEFYSDSMDGGLIEIGRIDIYPYTDQDPVPEGASDPALWT